MSDNGLPGRWPHWLPAGARCEIEQHLQSPETPETFRDVLLRLGNPEDENLRSEVWQKLPDLAKDREDEVIFLILIAYHQAKSLPAPRPKTKTEIDSHLDTIQKGTSPAAVGFCANLLAIEMRKDEFTPRLRWRELWQGDPNFDFDSALKFVEHLSDFYARLHQAESDALASLNLPAAPTYRGAKEAQIHRFTNVLGASFKARFDDPMDSIVAALAEVCFDKTGTISADTVRKRRERLQLRTI